MSIYRWAKLDDQSGPDRSIELTLALVGRRTDEDPPARLLLPGGPIFAGRTVCFSATAHADLHARLAATVWRRRERSRCRCEVSQSNSNCSCFVSQIPSLVSDSETAAAIDQ